MNGTMKRISQLVEPSITGNGPFAPLPEYSLSRSEDLFDSDLIIKDYSEVDGMNGKYMHIKVSQADGLGPVDGDFVITTGARAVMDKLNQIGKYALPVVAAFRRGQGSSGRTWYDID